VLRLMASGDLDTYRRLKLDSGLLDAVEGVLQSQLEHHLDRRLKSLQFLHQMRMQSLGQQSPPPIGGRARVGGLEDDDRP
jgi:hypothetical protein